MKHFELRGRQMFNSPYQPVRLRTESVNLRLSGMLYSADSGVLSSLLVEGT